VQHCALWCALGCIGSRAAMWTGCVLAVLLRYSLYFAGAPTYLDEQLTLTTPVTSFGRLREGLFLLDGGTSPYAGGTCHHPPLLLLLLFPLRHSPPIVHFTLLVLIDVATALLLRLIAVKYLAAKARAGRAWMDASLMRPLEKDKDGNRPAFDLQTALQALEGLSPAFVGLSYLFNPFVIFSCLAFSLQNLQHLTMCASIALAGCGLGGPAAAMLALALYVCPFTPIVLLLPVAYLAYERRNGSDSTAEEVSSYKRSQDSPFMNFRFMVYLAFFIVGVFSLFACLLGASVAAMEGQLHFLQASFLSVLSVQDLTPNVGLFWYIFIEVFDRYRAMFLIAFHAHLLFYPVPLHLRVGCHGPIGPWLQCAAAVGIITIFKPYPTAGDYGLMLSMLLIQFELIRECEKAFAFLLSGLLFGLVMFPTMVLVWLGRNAGNANFLYNMTLVVNIFSSLLLSEWIKAGMKLRRRQRTASFCRDVVLSAVEKAVEGKAH